MDDVSLAPTTGDLVLVNASDDMMLMTGSAFYGFATGASCAISDAEYQFPFVPGSGIIFDTEDHNGEYLCFTIQDHV